MYSLSKEGRPDDWWRKPTAETRFGLNSVSRQRTTREANHRVTPPAAVQQVAQQVDRGESDNASTSEHSSQSTRSIPLTGESTEEFFSSPSRNVISYRKTPSSTLSKSRTVSSLRNSPNRNMDSIPDEDEDILEVKHSIPRSMLAPKDEKAATFPTILPASSTSTTKDSSCLSSTASSSSKMLESASSEVSLSPTDVKFLVSALKRMGGEDFTGLIESIKKKEEPQLHFRSNKVLSREEDVPVNEVSISSPQREDAHFPEEESRDILVKVTVREATPPATPRRVVANLFQEGGGEDEPVNESQDDDEDSFESCEESASNSIVSDGLGQPVPLSRTDSGAPLTTRLYHFGEERINSILDTAGELDDETPVDGGVDAEDVMGGHPRRQWARRIPGFLFASSVQFNQAAEVVSKALSDGMEKAKAAVEVDDILSYLRPTTDSGNEKAAENPSAKGSWGASCLKPKVDDDTSVTIPVPPSMEIPLGTVIEENGWEDGYNVSGSPAVPGVSIPSENFDKSKGFIMLNHESSWQSVGKNHFRTPPRPVENDESLPIDESIPMNPPSPGSPVSPFDESGSVDTATEEPGPLPKNIQPLLDDGVVEMAKQRSQIHLLEADEPCAPSTRSRSALERAPMLEDAQFKQRSFIHLLEVDLDEESTESTYSV